MDRRRVKQEYIALISAGEDYILWLNKKSSLLRQLALGGEPTSSQYLAEYSWSTLIVYGMQVWVSTAWTKDQHEAYVGFYATAAAVAIHPKFYMHRERRVLIEETLLFSIELDHEVQNKACQWICTAPGTRRSFNLLESVMLISRLHSVLYTVKCKARRPTFEANNLGARGTRTTGFPRGQMT